MRSLQFASAALRASLPVLLSLLLVAARFCSAETNDTTSSGIVQEEYMQYEPLSEQNRAFMYRFHHILPMQTSHSAITPLFMAKPHDLTFFKLSLTPPTPTLNDDMAERRRMKQKRSKKKRKRGKKRSGKTVTTTIATALPGKKGVAMQLNPPGQAGSWVTNLPKVIALQPYWNYNWGPNRIDQQPANIEFVPMIWGAWNAAVLNTTIETVIKPAFEAGLTQRLLGFNEPDSSTQSNMPVSKAIKFWPLLQIPGMPLASPAVATIQGKWMTKFVRKINKRKRLYMDYVAVHWYGSPSVSQFQSQMLSIYQGYGSQWPLLITEFAPADWSAKTVSQNRFSPSQVLSFAQRVLPWLEQQDWIYGYAWFPFNATFPPGWSSALFDVHGNQTALGRYYASVRTNSPSGNQSITV